MNYHEEGINFIKGKGLFYQFKKSPILDPWQFVNELETQKAMEYSVEILKQMQSLQELGKQPPANIDLLDKIREQASSIRKLAFQLESATLHAITARNAIRLNEESKK